MDDLHSSTDPTVDQATTSSISIEYSTKSITHFLKNNPDEWTIQPKDKQSNVKRSQVWHVFGIPSKIDENGEYSTIDDYTSCFRCLTTYVNKKDTGTKSLRYHPCFKKYVEEQKQETESNLSVQKMNSSANSTLKSSINTSPLIKYGLVLKTPKLTSYEQKKIKEDIVQWLCQSMRPFSIVNDVGLRNLVQQAINMGAKYGNIDADLVIPRRTTITEYSKMIANDRRTQLTSLFIELQRFKSITLTPDLWTDKFNTASYLGITCTMINSNFYFCTFDLAMLKYTEPDKKAENIAVAMDKALTPFGWKLSNANIMCDRGSNFVKCFKDYNPLHCFAHRLNNIMKKCFFQMQRQRVTDVLPSNCSTTTSGVDGILYSTDEDFCDEADDELIPSIKLKQKRKANENNKRTKKTNSSLPVVDHMKLNVTDIPMEARQYLMKLKEIKSIVKYVKKAGLNDEIKEMASISLKQSSSVRWLSLINSLTSFLRAYKATKRVLQKHGKQVNVDPNDLKWMIHLLLPFKVISEKVQTGNKPSLHMVLLSTFILRRTLSSAKELQQFYTDFYNDNKVNVELRNDSEEDELNVEVEPPGITFFRGRMAFLFENMSQLDMRHYAAVLLHPKYSKMFNCSKNEIEQTYKWVREELKKIIIEDAVQDTVALEASSKRKTNSSIFDMFSNSAFANSTHGINDIEEEDDDDEDPDSHTFTHDELNHYLFLLKKKTENEPELANEDPLPWWKKHTNHLQKLSILVRQLFSIPGTSASVERQFSSAGMIFNDRRTRLSGENLENIILISSIENQDKNAIGALI